MIGIKFKINENVKKFLKKEQNYITINLKSWSSWDCEVILRPSVLIGKPVNFSDYNVYNLENIEIYVTKKIDYNDSIELFTTNFFGVENLVAVIK